MIICEKCKEEFKTNAALHKHVKAHGLKISDYYYIYHPRFDLYDKKMIEFKNLNYYMSTSFNNRLNFIEWLKTATKESAIAYFIEFLKNRKLNKNIRYLPCHVELKGLIAPSYHSLLKIFKDKDSLDLFASSIGLQQKYNYYTADINLTEPEKGLEIFVDTREELPFLFKDSKTISMKLICGDYTVKNEDLYSDVYIERKSINDLYGTMGKGFDRFCRELERAQELNHYIVVVVESSFKEADSYVPYFSKHSSFKPMAKVREICQRFDNCQFVFGGTRSECSNLVEKIFKLKGQVRALDLEYIKDKGII